MAETISREDRNLTWRVAVISALSALAGAFVGGLFTFVASIHQSTSQAAEDRQSFVRTQRQAAYGNVAAHGQAILAGLVRCDTAAVLDERSAADLSSSVTLPLSKAEDALETDVGSVTIIGSVAAVARAGQLQIEVRGASASCNALLQDLSRSGTNAKSTRTDGRILERRETTVRTDLNSFFAAAQRDVQR